MYTLAPCLKPTQATSQRLSGKCSRPAHVSLASTSVMAISIELSLHIAYLAALGSLGGLMVADTDGQCVTFCPCVCTSLPSDSMNLAYIQCMAKHTSNITKSVDHNILLAHGR